MNSFSIINMCLMLGVLGLALDASANLINCNKASGKWFEPVSECEDEAVEFRNGFNFSFKVPNKKWDANESFFLNKDDLISAQFVIDSLTNNAGFINAGAITAGTIKAGSITGNQLTGLLTGLCVDNDDCQKSSQSLIRHYPGGASVSVSEPAPLLLVILGLLGLGLVRRRLR